MQRDAPRFGLGGPGVGNSRDQELRLDERVIASAFSRRWRAMVWIHIARQNELSIILSRSLYRRVASNWRWLNLVPIYESITKGQFAWGVGRFSERAPNLQINHCPD